MGTDMHDVGATRAARQAAVLTLIAGLGLTLSACAQGGIDQIAGLASNVKPPAGQAGETRAMPQSELARATEYWGKKFAANPRDGKIAVNYARNLKAMGQKRRALAVLQQASIFNGNDARLASEYGRLALDLGQTSLGAKILAKVDDPTRPDWRVISARGAALAKLGRHKEALQYFERARMIAPNKASVLNNLAMAYTMDGQPTRAEKLLRTALGFAKPKLLPRIKQNLSLVLGLQGKYDEAKTVVAGEIGEMNARANVDAIRKLVKLKPQLSPAARAEAIIKMARAAAARQSVKKTARSKTTRKNKVPLRRSSTRPAPLPRKAAPETVAQASSPLVLRPTTH